MVSILMKASGHNVKYAILSMIRDNGSNSLKKEPGNMNLREMKWTREPAEYTIGSDRIEITTMPHTDLWQRTYYHFRNDNAPVLQMETEEKYFSFIVRTDFAESHHRFDQCGIVMYLDSENWLKGSVEYENESFQHDIFTDAGLPYVGRSR